MAKNKLIIVGDSAFAEIAYEYFTYESNYQVAAFSVEREYLKRKELFGVPVVPFEDLEKLFDPNEYGFFVALTYKKLNATRTRLFIEAKSKGFKAVSYISPRAFVWRNVKIGENCFVFEGNVIQPFAKIGDNVILWSGNHIGHHSIIGDNCFISSHVVVSGFVEVGKNCFLGVNSCIVDGKKIAIDCVIGAGAVVLNDTDPGKVYVGNPARPLQKSSYETFQV